MRFMMRYLLFAAVIILSACPVYAQIYQYFDEEGTLIVTDNPYGTRKQKPKPDNVYQEIRLPYRKDVSYDFYPVTGKNIQELMTSTQMNGPYDAADRKKYAAQTRWNTGWSYKYHSSYTVERPYVYVSLNIFDIEFMSDISILLPAMPEGTALNYHDMTFWEHFVVKLLDHEHDHVKIVQDPFYREEAAKKITAIRQLTLPYNPLADLDTLIKDAVEAETARIGHDFIKTIKRENDEYDRLTDHGLKPEMRTVFFGK